MFSEVELKPILFLKEKYYKNYTVTFIFNSTVTVFFNYLPSKLTFKVRPKKH